MGSGMEGLTSVFGSSRYSTPLRRGTSTSVLAVNRLPASLAGLFLHGYDSLMCIQELGT